MWLCFIRDLRMVRGISTSEIGESVVLTEGAKRSLETFVGKPVDEIETPGSDSGSRCNAAQHG